MINRRHTSNDGRRTYGAQNMSIHIGGEHIGLKTISIAQIGIPWMQ